MTFRMEGIQYHHSVLLVHTRLENESSFWTVKLLASSQAMALDVAENICLGSQKSLFYINITGKINVS